MKLPFINRTKDLKVNLDYGTNIGLKRTNNEDNGIVLSGDESPAGTRAVMVVADGMGGHESGEVASAIVVNCILSNLSELDLEVTIPPGGYREFLSNLVVNANSEIRQFATRHGKANMGTTCTSAILEGETFHFSHVGDSRAYLFRDSQIFQITSDHSWVAEQVELGNITAEESRTHPRRNVITRALGIDNQVKVDTKSIQIQKADFILICSDGLHGLVSDSEIQSVIENNKFQDVAESLINSALEKGGTDNITVAICQVK